MQSPAPKIPRTQSNDATQREEYIITITLLNCISDIVPRAPRRAPSREWGSEQRQTNCI